MPSIDVFSETRTGFASLDVSVDCDGGGYLVEVQVPDQYSATLVRVDAGGTTPVRGMKDIPPNTYMRVVDYEISLRGEVEYILYQQIDAVRTAMLLRKRFILSFEDQCGGADQNILRWLFKPSVMTKDFCIGEINEVAYNIKAGVHAVIGRRDPVVVVDEQETARGMLRFISRNRGELHQLKLMLASKAQPMLLQMNPDYELGNLGRLYFMPLQVRDRWVMSDARLPQHVFEVEFVEIAPPPATATFVRFGVPFGLARDDTWHDKVYPTGGWVDFGKSHTDFREFKHLTTDNGAKGIGKSIAKVQMDGATQRTYRQILVFKGHTIGHRWPTFLDLAASGKTFSEAYYDQP